jgi:membrane protein
MASFTASSFKDLVKETFSEWSKDKASRLAAALSYYTIFSVAPLLIIAVAVAGLVFGREEASRHLADETRDLLGPQGAEAIQTMLQNAGKTGAGLLATVVGIGTLLLGASGAFAQLQDALNTIWEVKPKEGRGVRGMLRDRFLSFSLVLAIGFLLLVSLVLSAALAAVGKYLAGVLPVSSALMQALNFALSFAATTFLFALIFKVLPDVRIRWRDVWVGAAVTALLFSIGRFLIGLYLGRSSVSSAYGAAGSLVVVLVWVYYSAQILLLGAEFTQVYASKFGMGMTPKPNAERLVPLAGGPREADRSGPEAPLRTV